MHKQELLDAVLQSPVIHRLPLAILLGEPLAPPLLQSKSVIARDACQMAEPLPSTEQPGAGYRLTHQLRMEVLLAASNPLAFVRGE